METDAVFFQLIHREKRRQTTARSPTNSSTSVWNLLVSCTRWKKKSRRAVYETSETFFFTLSLSLASGNNLSLSDRSVHRGGKRSVQVAGTCFCLSFFLSFFFLLIFFSPISKLDDLGPWLDVCTSAGRSRDPDASEQKTLVETQEWEREQVPGTKTWKSETPGVERGAGTSDPGTLSTNSLREWFKPGLKIRTGAEGGAQEEKKRNLGDDSTVASTLFEHSGRWLIINCLIK